MSWYHYHDFLQEFDAIVPVADELYVVDGDRVTSSGGIGAALAAAHLVERRLDAGSAQKALRIVQIDRARSTATLQPAPPLTLSCDDDRVTRALLIMEQNINSPIQSMKLPPEFRLVDVTSSAHLNDKQALLRERCI
jgi:transcriptional regulator GlxA family with amidase domain